MSRSPEPETVPGDVPVRAAALEAARAPAAPAGGAIDRLRRAVTSRGAALCTLADQAVVSLLNFVGTVIVGKLAGAHELGLYVLAFTAVILTAAACDALVGTPYMARHWHLPEARRRLYSGSAAVHQAMLSGIAALAMAVVAIACAVVFRDAHGAEIWAVAAFAIPAVLAREFARRFSIAHMRPGHALAADAVAGVFQLACLVGLALSGRLDAVTALAAMALASAIAAATWLVLARPQMSFDGAAIREDFARSRIEGFWTLAALGSLLVQFFAPTWTLAFLSTPEAVGRFAACQSLVMISNPLVTALANMVMPRAASAYAERGVAGVRAVALRATTGLAIAMVLASAPFALAGGPLVAQLYGEAFADLGLTVAILAVATGIRGAGMLPYVGLWAIEHSRANAAVNAFAIAAMLLVMPALFAQFGLVGAAAASLVGAVFGITARWTTFLVLSRGVRHA